MATGIQPTTHSERAEVMQTIDGYVSRDDANPAAVELVNDFLRAEMEQYRSARADFVVAEATYAAASSRVDEADAHFDKQMRKLANSVDDEDGKRDSPALRALLGDRTMSEVIRMKPTDEVLVAREMLARIPHRSDIRVNPARVEALREAVDRLDAETGPWKAAERAVAAAGIAQEAGIAALRVGWSDFLRFARRRLDAATLAELTPPFMRRSGQGGGNGGGNGGNGDAAQEAASEAPVASEAPAAGAPAASEAADGSP